MQSLCNVRKPHPDAGRSVAIGLLRCCVALSMAALTLPTPAAATTRVDIVGPPGSVRFGRSVTVLPNGNIVITDPSGVASNVGAVYLYSPVGEKISALTGGTANDFVGSGGITVLPSGNFLVSTPQWHNGAASGAGAVTFVNGTTGLNGVVSAANSLVGSTTDDAVGGAITVLANGNYVVRSAQWDRGAIVNAGAVTWGSGSSGVSGAVSVSNSLVGSTAYDAVGYVTALDNGNYVVSADDWDNGAVDNAGAVTWCNGSTGRTGAVTTANSLYGTQANDAVGLGVIALANGNYAVGSYLWANGAVKSAGAVTLGNGASGTFGAVSVANSLVGTTFNDRVGNRLARLSNGHLVAISQQWNNGAATVAGAVTWINGSSGKVGAVSAANSMVGTQQNDFLGDGNITVLANGNYVVSSPYWHNGANAAGAVTWCNGQVGRVGALSAANSLVGTSAGDGVGRVYALANGHYVVASYNWSNGAASNVGAVTWGSGTTGATGVVSPANSLIGTTSGDRVGFQLLPLDNGSYLVGSSYWSNGASSKAGAATWLGGSGPTSAVVSAANSLVGSATDDSVGFYLRQVGNSNYVVQAPSWDNGGIVNAGAVIWGNGVGGVHGPITPFDALVGSHTGDQVGGGGLIVLSDTNFVVSANEWSNGVVDRIGAVTWINGNTGLTGTVSAANSLVGSTAVDFVGNLRAFEDGTYAVLSQSWDNGSTVDAGAVTLGRAGGVQGPISAANSLLGTVSNGGNQHAVDYDPARNTFVVGLAESNRVVLVIGDLFEDGFE